MATTRINKLCGSLGKSSWQKSFYERIVRNEFELERIQEYILYNPDKWVEDCDNPASPNFGLHVKTINDYWNEIYPK